MIDNTLSLHHSGRNVRALLWLTVLLTVGIFSASQSARAQLPANFTQETVLSGLSAPVYLETLPDGRMLLLRQTGQILIFDPADQPAQTSPYLTITNINATEERGLTSLVLDPDFESNGYFYVYYTHGTTQRNRISRFTHDGDTASLASEVLIWQDNTNWSSCCHYGGGLDFGPDGKLYLTTGEEFDGAQSQDLTQAGGKILRINKDGTIPGDNPFVDGPGGNLDEIWAIGLRNPYRAHWDLVNQRFYIGDVGGNVQEDAREELNVGVAGGNYGWPSCEGVCNNPAWEEPIYDYGHMASTPNGGAITAGFVYRGSQYPAEYAGAMFVADYVLSEIKYLVFNGDGSVASVNDFTSDVGAPVMLEQGSDGAMYAVDYIGRVLRFTYNSSNQVPQITDIDVSPTLGAPPLNATFSATATDPEGQPLTYRWLFGDGTEQTGQNVGHNYTQAGTYSVVLQVSDGVRIAFSDPIIVEVGTPPVVTINTPADGATFRAGNVINYSGTAVDPDETIPAANYRWDIEFFHNAHTHPVVTQQQGMSGQLTIQPSGHDWHDDTGYELTLTVTDSQGISRSDSIRIYPEKVDLTFATVPAGIPVYIDGIPTNAPFTYDTLIGFQHVVAVPGSYCLNNQQQVFMGWSDGGAATHQISVPTANQTLTATFTAGGACDAIPTSGLVAHFEADTGVTTAAGVVTGWLDQSGSGNNLVAAGDPALVSLSGGVPVIDFDGNGDKLERVGSLVGLPSGNANRTAFVVANYRGVGYGGVAWGTEDMNQTFGLIVDPVGQLMVQGWGVDNDFESGNYASGDGLLVQSVVFAGGALSHYRNGQLIDSRNHTYATGTTRFVLGAEIDSNPAMDMQIGAVLVYDRALTTLERQRVETYLQEKYFNNLPVAHDDSYSVAEDATLTVLAANGVLIDDTDADDDPLTAVLEADVAHGTLSLASNGSFTYEPDTDFSGTDSFTYRADDGKGQSAPATVTITVTAINDPPTAVADSYSIGEDSTLTTTAGTGVLVNDVDGDGGVLSAVLVANVSHGTLVLNANGSFTYTPAENFNGADSFTYRANDGLADSNVVTVSITVNAGNDLPVAVADSYSVNEDSALNVGAPGVLGNDTDVDGNPLTAVLAANVTHGTLALNANGSFTYTPNPNYSGPDSFTYRANDGVANGNVVTVSITVNASNDAPTANGDAYGVNEDETLTRPAPGVLGNDTDPDSDPLTAVLVSDVANGTLVLGANGSFTYTPDEGFGGTDSFTYRASDGTLTSNVVTVVITVTAVDDPPRQTGTIVAPAATESVAYVFDLGTFFEDAEGQPLYYEANVGPHPVGLPLSGHLMVDPDGSLTGTRGRLFGTPTSADTSDDGPRTVTLTVADRPFTDPNRRELTTTFELTISAADQIDLSVSAAATPSPAAIDETVEWKFVITNGNALVPANQVELELSFNGSAPFAFKDTNGCTAAAQVVSCVFGPVPAGGSVTRTVTLAATDAGDVHVAAEVSMPANGPIDPNTTNNTAVAAISVGESFSSGPAQSLTALPSVAVAVGDLNGDGFDDVVVAGGVGQSLGVYFSESKDPADPDSEFRKLATTPTVLVQLSTHVQDLLLVDVDNDGDLDVVLANGAAGTPEGNSVFLNELVGDDVVLTQVASLGNQATRAVAAADLDGNGFVDLVFANGSPNEVFFNQGSGVFAPAASLGNRDTRGVAIADFDGDLLPDLAFANADGASQVYRNLGAGAFAPPLSVESEPAHAVAAADLDGDGKADLVFGRAAVTVPNVPSDTVYLNTSTVGAIAFTKLSDELGAAPTARLLLGDFDESGTLDVLVLNMTGTHQVYVNGGQAFTLHAEQFSTGVPTGAAIGDFNNDGRPDVAIATSEGVEVFLNDGQGNLGAGDTIPPTITLTGQSSMTLTVGGAFADPGATATDAIDGSLTSEIKVTNPVNSAVAGTYSVVYEVADRSGNTARATRTVNVQAPAPSGGGGGSSGGGGSMDMMLLALLLAAWCYRERGAAVARRVRPQLYTAG